MAGNSAFKAKPSHQRRTAPRLAPTQIARMDFHMRLDPP
jgi:hypothetical protein